MITFLRPFIILFIFLLTKESDASLTDFFPKLFTPDQPNSNLVQVSHLSWTSPAPGPSPQLNSRSVHVTEEICGASVLHQCHDDINKVIACLPAAEDGSQGSTLIVRNDGETNLRLNFTLFPVNYTYKNLQMSKHQLRKINMLSNIRGSSSIRVEGEYGGCVIHLGAPIPLENLYKGYVTPVNGAYLLFATLVLIGGICACCRFRNKGRHLDGGVPYQEIEMKNEKEEALPYVETADNWNQSWDDDWDEEKAVRSPGGNRPQSW